MKYVRVMEGLRSNAGGFEYKLDEVNIAKTWNPDKEDPKEMGGFNFGTEDKILRWLHRGDTIYDVVIPNDAEVILVDSLKGIYRTNKIIVKNPRKITDELVMDLYKKNTLSDKILAQSLVTLLWKERVDIVKYIIKDRVNLSNIDVILKEFLDYSNGRGRLSSRGKEILEILKEIQSPLAISLYVDKDVYVKKLSDDRVINITGQSGSGKSTYAMEHYNSPEYLIIDTDLVLSDNENKKVTGINKEIGDYLRNKYKVLPNCGDNFDLIYKEILDYCKDIDKTIVIDSAQFHCIKRIKNLKGTIIIIRTCIETCYYRTIERFKLRNPDATEEELNMYKERKKALYKWYKYSNEFIYKIDKI